MSTKDFLKNFGSQLLMGALGLGVRAASYQLDGDDQTKPKDVLKQITGIKADNKALDGMEKMLIEAKITEADFGEDEKYAERLLKQAVDNLEKLVDLYRKHNPRK